MPGLSQSVLGPGDTVVPPLGAYGPGGGEVRGRQLPASQIIIPVNIILKRDTCNRGELGALERTPEALRVWGPGKV